MVISKNLGVIKRSSYDLLHRGDQPVFQTLWNWNLIIISIYIIIKKINFRPCFFYKFQSCAYYKDIWVPGPINIFGKWHSPKYYFGPKIWQKKFQNFILNKKGFLLVKFGQIWPDFHDIWNSNKILSKSSKTNPKKFF